ncbi:aminoalkylphosphonate N-acetyltransferase [Salmonella enterica subsp. enterica serovar Leatherhead]|nr:aminoalkylphosphonate N-acetyltransferase [Salmonella enterica subsp. enterica serovar Aba]ECA1329187.1 aminoalkylphosphonate N-acetyltransferase [Salmonella enterica subsp. enterica serovar Leatherhead]ECI5564435.1 aminoalkylphosphonate N-acetyltransferase [Salmonella enterica subsp. enterica]EEP5170088.1 aminoalkylphosphonate N-acetyltransferase [Salmonella enterica subsp. enterica serovar Aba]
MILMKRQEDIMSVCELRHATTEDTDSVYALICELLKNELDYQAFRDGFAANLLDPNVHYRLALRNGEIVGMISLHMQFHLHHANWIGEIQELVVLPQMRGQKVGSQLLAWAEEEARQAGAELTELSTNIKRRDAHRFYLREGYKQSHFRFTKAL